MLYALRSLSVSTPAATRSTVCGGCGTDSSTRDVGRSEEQRGGGAGRFSVKVQVLVSSCWRRGRGRGRCGCRDAQLLSATNVQPTNYALSRSGPHDAASRDVTLRRGDVIIVLHDDVADSTLCDLALEASRHASFRSHGLCFPTLHNVKCSTRHTFQRGTLLDSPFWTLTRAALYLKPCVPSSRGEAACARRAAETFEIGRALHTHTLPTNTGDMMMMRLVAMDWFRDIQISQVFVV